MRGEQTTDRFAPYRNAIKQLEKDIARELKRAEPELKRLVREGRYEAEALYGAEVSRRVNVMQQEIRHLRMRLPPFVTFEDGVYHRHLVTPENMGVLRGGF